MERLHTPLQPCPPESTGAPLLQRARAFAHWVADGLSFPKNHDKLVYDGPHTDTTLPLFLAAFAGLALLTAAGETCRFVPRAGTVVVGSTGLGEATGRDGAGVDAGTFELLLAPVSVRISVCPRLLTSISLLQLGQVIVIPLISFLQSRM